jgi:predicted RND superfamily exporter protein
MKKLKIFIKKKIKLLSWITLFIFFGLFTASVGFIAGHINFNYELKSFFPEGNENLAFYLEHVKRFESDHDVLLVSLTNKKGIFKKDFLKKVKEVNDSISNMYEVTDIVGPLQMARIRMADPLPVKLPFLHVDDEDKYEKDSLRLMRTNHFVKNFISFGAGSLCFICKIRPELKIDSSKAFCERLMKYLDTQGFTKARVSGRVRGQTHIIGKMQKEFILLATITAVALLFFLYITFRNFWGVLLPFTVVTIGITFTLVAILAISGSLNLISVILPTVLFVVGVSDSVHVLNSFYTELNHGHDKITAIILTVKEIGRATFLTAITSAIGFFTLITVNVKPIADFGVYSAIGIMVIYFVSFTFLIACLVLLKPFYLPPQKEIIKHEPFRKLFYFVLKRRKIIAFTFIAMLIPLIMGTFKIKVNNFFTEDLMESDPYKKDFMFFDKHFGGVRPYEISINVKKGVPNVFDKRVVHELDKFETYLNDSLKVKGIFSSNTLLKVAHQANNKGNEDAFVLPVTNSAFAQDTSILRKMLPYFGNAVASRDLQYARITGRINDIGAIEVRKLHARLERFYKTQIDTNVFSYQKTGLSEIIDGNIRYLTANMMDGLIYELLAIGFLMGLLFRSAKIMFLSLVPNIFPLVFIGGIMGIFGINLNVSSSIIFSIAFGITVDDTIHMLARYRLEQAKGLDNKTALINAYMHSGKAVAMTSVILFSGFSILMLSSFTGIFNTGMLISLTLVVAVFSDLFMLPLLFGYNKKVKKNPDEDLKHMS